MAFKEEGLGGNPTGPAGISLPLAHLGDAVEGFLQLQVFSRLAGQIHPLPFEPPNGGFLQQGLGIHFSHKCDVFTWTRREQQIR